jgi:feruloyl esterase
MNKPILLLLAAFPAVAAAASSCESIGLFSLPNTSITIARSVAPGAFPPPPGGRGPNAGAAYKNLPAFCRVGATLKPTSDSSVEIELWMPDTAAWNGKFQAVGNGAWAGSISYPAMATALAAGYAAASTDTGHQGNSAAFVPGHPEKVIDFAWRAVHEMTVASKALIAAYYADGPKHSYWNGCSTGGRQALTEAQRFPNDYDGIVAGAPANYTTHLQGSQVWTSAISHKDEAGYIPADKYAVLHKAVLEQCDALDGIRDGVLEDPTRCKFDPKVVECKSEADTSCLTPAQVATARNIYAGPGNFPGLEPGSEAGWATLAGPKPMDYAVDIYRLLVFNDPAWNPLTINPTADVPRAEKAIGGMMDATDPNLRPFFAHGGKLIQYHGWADPGIAPGSSVDYYKRVAKALGPAVADSYRLFMVPGMGHCGGGDGTSTFDMVSALDQWVTGGKAPARIPASRVIDGAVVRTRPLCPYPQTAAYKGTGSTDEAANFTCK